jgi:hypothetical protein
MGGSPLVRAGNNGRSTREAVVEEEILPEKGGDGKRTCANFPDRDRKK